MMKIKNFVIDFLENSVYAFSNTIIIIKTIHMSVESSLTKKIYHIIKLNIFSA